MTASEVFEAVTGSGSSDFATLVSILNRRGSWCLIGGLAVNCYVEPVYTLDADVVVIASELPAIKDELVRAGFSVEEFPHSLDARMPKSDLRIQFSLDPRYQDFMVETTVREVLGQQVPVASLGNIVRGKIWAWSDDRRRLSKRKKDELDLIRILEKYPEFRDLMPDEIVRQL
ncbi:MAG: nucleotidyl transferase AbiEii/AbiGii toxin family protein [Acidobacteriota bacterium]